MLVALFLHFSQDNERLSDCHQKIVLPFHQENTPRSVPVSVPEWDGILFSVRLMILSLPICRLQSFVSSTDRLDRRPVAQESSGVVLRK